MMEASFTIEGIDMPVRCSGLTTLTSTLLSSGLLGKKKDGCRGIGKVMLELLSISKIVAMVGRLVGSS